MKKFIPTLLLVLPISSFAMESNLTAELLLGQTTQKEKFDNGFPTIKASDTSLGLRGALNLHKNISIELSYQDFGTAEDTVTGFGSVFEEEIKTTALLLGVKGILPINKQLSLNARLGISKWDYEFKETDTTPPPIEYTDKDDGTDMYYGVGVEYQLNENYFLGLEYSYLEMEAEIGPGLKFDREVESLTLSFGIKI